MTIKEAMQLSDTNLQIKVAELTGWIRCDTEDLAYYHHDGRHSDDFDCPQVLPDYVNDLNAMHEVEKSHYFNMMTMERKAELYQVAMTVITGARTPSMFATAKQKSICFVVAMTENYDGGVVT